MTNAPGEDVVAGTRLTKPISALKVEMPPLDVQPVCQEDLPQAGEAFPRSAGRGVHHRAPEQILTMLQTRDAKRTAQAAVRIAVDLANEHLITKAEAVQRVKLPGTSTTSCIRSST